MTSPLPVIQKVVPDRAPIGPESLVLVRFGERCNMACPMCSNTGAPELATFPTAELLRRVDRVAGLGFRRAVFTGGEPTIHPGFFELARRVQGHGIRWDLNTHGATFARRDLAERARELGLTRAIVSLHSHDPATSARITAAPARMHAKTVTGIEHLLDAGVSVMTNVVLTTLNLHELEPYLAFCAARFGRRASVKISFPSIEVPRADWEPIGLRYDDVRAVLRAVPRWAEAHGIESCFQSVPSCVHGDATARDVGRSGWGETHYLDDRTGTEVHSMAFIEAALSVHAPACRSCPALEQCPGVGRRYAERFGVGELTPFPPTGGTPWWV